MNLRSTALLMLVAACSVQSVFGQQPTIRWAPDLETARKAAAQFQVPVMVHFYGDNCLPCEMLEQRVFSQAEVVDTLNKYFICVKINATDPAGRAIAAEQFQVHSWPTDVFLSPDAKNLHQGVSPQDLPTYISVLQNVAVRNRDRNLMLAAQQNNTVLQGQQVAAPGMPQPTQTGQPTTNPTQQSSLYAHVDQYTPPSMQVTTQQLAAARAAQQAVTPTAKTQLGAYNRPPGTSEQPAIGPSMAPATGVQSGPLTAATQPSAIAGAVQGAEQQVLGTALPTSNTDGTNSLPPRSQIASVASPNATPTFNQASTGGLPPRVNQNKSLAAYNSMPKMTSQDRPTQESQPKVETAAAQLNNTTPHDVENPYFNPPQSQSEGQRPVNLYSRQQFGQQNMQARAPAQQYVAPNIQRQASVAGAPNMSPAMKLPPQTAETQTFAPQLNPTAAVTYPSAAPKGASVGPQNVIPQNVIPQNGIPQTAGPQGMGPTNAQPQNVGHQPSLSAGGPQASMPTFQPRAHASTMGEPKVDLTSAVAASSMIQEQATTNPASQTGVSAMPTEELALEGYCPVALQAESHWIEGKPEFSVRHRGKVYWLSSKEALQKFMGDPDASSPVLSGYDPYALVEQGRMVPGNIQYGLHDVVSGKYMLFESPESKQKFWADFDRYSLALSALIQRSNTAP